MEPASELYVVRVNIGQTNGGIPIAMLYAVVSDTPEHAVEAVRRAIPASWHIELTDIRLAPETIERLALRPGEARSLA